MLRVMKNTSLTNQCLFIALAVGLSTHMGLATDITSIASSWKNNTSGLDAASTGAVNILSIFVWGTRIACFPAGYFAWVKFHQEDHKGCWTICGGILIALLWPIGYNWLVGITDTANQSAPVSN